MITIGLIATVISLLFGALVVIAAANNPRGGSGPEFAAPLLLSCVGICVGLLLVLVGVAVWLAG